MNPDKQHDDVTIYVDLINDLLEDRISAEEFQRQYMETFTNEQRFFEDRLYQILNRLFTDADCYVAYPELRTEPEDYDDEQLRAKAREARAALTPHLGS